MFDVGFSELFLLLVVGLIVLGPERLPKVARTVGLWVGRARAMYTNVRSDIERELELEELKRAREAIRQQLAEDATGPIMPPEAGSVSAAKGEPAHTADEPPAAEEAAEPNAGEYAAYTTKVKDEPRHGGEG